MKVLKEDDLRFFITGFMGVSEKFIMKRKIAIIILSVLVPFLHLHAQNNAGTNEIFDGNYLYNDVKIYVGFGIRRTCIATGNSHHHSANHSKRIIIIRNEDQY